MSVETMSRRLSVIEQTWKEGSPTERTGYVEELAVIGLRAEDGDFHGVLWVEQFEHLASVSPACQALAALGPDSTPASTDSLGQCAGLVP